MLIMPRMPVKTKNRFMGLGEEQQILHCVQDDSIGIKELLCFTRKRPGLGVEDLEYLRFHTIVDRLT